MARGRARRSTPYVVATQDHHIDPGDHFPDPDFVDSWPRHCVVGTDGEAFHPNLDPQPFDAIFLKGDHAAAYSGFEGHTPTATGAGRLAARARGRRGRRLRDRHGLLRAGHRAGRGGGRLRRRGCCPSCPPGSRPSRWPRPLPRCGPPGCALADLEVSVDGGALWLRLNRPEVLNALSDEMAADLARLVEEATARDDVRVVVLSGTGAVLHRRRPVGRRRPRALRRPGAGRREPDRAGDHEPRQAGGRGRQRGRGRSRLLGRPGCGPGGGGRVRELPAGLHPDRADAGRRRDGHRRGLDRAGPGDADGAARRGAAGAGGVRRRAGQPPRAGRRAPGRRRDLVARLAAGPPLAYAATKKAVNAATLAQLEGSLERERSGQAVLLRTADVAEGMRAFGERRRPVFRGE